jgi:hypothetical protein
MSGHGLDCHAPLRRYDVAFGARTTGVIGGAERFAASGRNGRQAGHDPLPTFISQDSSLRSSHSRNTPHGSQAQAITTAEAAKQRWQALHELQWRQRPERYATVVMALT